MKQSVIRELVKQALIETLAEKDITSDGAMTPEEEEMVANYEKQQAAEYALDNEKPMEEAMVSPDNRVAYLVNALDHVWNMGKGNNLTDFKSLAQSLINDMFDEEPLEEAETDIIAQAREIIRKSKEEEDTVTEATKIVEAWKKTI